MSGLAQAALVASLSVVAAACLVHRILRPATWLILYMVANIADFGFAISGRGLSWQSVSISDILLGLAVASTLISSDRSETKWPSTATFISFFLAVGTVQLARGAGEVGLQAALGEGRFLLFPLAWFVAYSVTRRIDDPSRLLVIFAVATSAVAAVGIAIYIATAAASLELVYVPGRLAAYAVFTFALLASGLVPRLRRVGPLLVLLLVGFLVVSGSRQSVALIPLLYLVVRRQPTQVVTRTVTTGALLIVLAIGIGAVGSAAARPLANIEDYRSTAIRPFEDRGVAWRLTYWEALVDETPRTQWVYGTGILPYFSTLELDGFNGDEADTPHNSLLVMTLLGGLPLTISYLAIVISILRRHLRSGAGHAIGDLAMFVVVASHVLLLFNAEHRIAGIWPMMWILLGILDAMQDRSTTQAESDEASGFADPIVLVGKPNAVGA